MKTATTGLQAASGEVIDTHDQYEVGHFVFCVLAIKTDLTREGFQFTNGCELQAR